MPIYDRVEKISGPLDREHNIFEKVSEFCNEYLEKTEKGDCCCPFCNSGKHENRTSALKVYDSYWNCLAGQDGDGLHPNKPYTILPIAAQVALTNYTFRDTVKDTVTKLGGDADAIDGYLHKWDAGGKKFIPPQLYEALCKTLAVKYKVLPFDPERNKNKKTEVKKPVKENVVEMQYAFYIRKHKIDFKNEKAGGMRYLTQRGITPEVAEKMHIAFDDCWVSASRAMATAEKEGVNMQEAERRLRERHQGFPSLVIPYWNPDGTVVAYNVRNIVPPPGEAKYHKIGKNLPIYNYANVIRNNPKSIFLVEGELDALSLMVAGQENVVAIGANRGKELMEMLKKDGQTPALIIALDNDDVGRKAGEYLRDLLKENGFKTVLSRKLYEDCKDANEMLVNHKDNFIRRLNNARALAEREDKSIGKGKEIE